MSVTDPSTSILVVATKFHNGTVMCQLGGELDIAGSGELTEAVERALGIGGVSSVEIDVADLTFVDCRGLREIADVHDRLLEHHVTVRFINPPACLRRLLTLTDQLHWLEEPQPQLRSESGRPRRAMHGAD